MSFPACKRSLEITTLTEVNLIPYSVDVTEVREDLTTFPRTYGSDIMTQILTHMQPNGSYYALIHGNNHAAEVVQGRVENVTFAPATEEDYQKVRPRKPIFTITQAQYRSIDSPSNLKLTDLVSLKGE